MKPSTIIVALFATCAASVINGASREFATPWAQDFHRSVKQKFDPNFIRDLRATTPATTVEPPSFTDDVE